MENRLSTNLEESYKQKYAGTIREQLAEELRHEFEASLQELLEAERANCQQVLEEELENIRK